MGEDEMDKAIETCDGLTRELGAIDKLMSSVSDELKALQMEVRVKRVSEEQMKQVLKEYEKTISELIAEKKREKVTYEEDKLRLMAERDQATDDLKVRLMTSVSFMSSAHWGRKNH